MGAVSFLPQSLPHHLSVCGMLILETVELNFLACPAKVTGYYDIYLQTGSDVPTGRTCSNYQTLHLPCLC